MTDNRSPLPTFLKLRLRTNGIAVGERIKKGTFRPCVETLPTSTVMGCLKECFGLDNIVAIGFFDTDTYAKAILTYAPADAVLGTAKLPLTIEYLRPGERHKHVEGDIYISATPQTRDLFREGKVYTILMGAFRSKGLGECQIWFDREWQPVRKTGYLRGALRESDAPGFGIVLRRDLIRPHYGYLFRPDAHGIGGVYERALLVGSILEGPDFMIAEEYTYDR